MGVLIFRNQADKNNGRVDFKWVDRFNAWVDFWSLLEINMSCRIYTWANNQADLIMSRIDRIFCTINFVDGFPLASPKCCLGLGVTILLLYGIPGLVKHLKKVASNLKNGG